MAREEKLKRLPSTHRRSKRPLLRPPIASPYTNASSAKVVYVSAKTPFISAVKRVRKLLAQVEKRSLGNASLLERNSGRSDKQSLLAIAAKPSKPEAVYLRATGRAIEKGLNLALYFQNQQDCQVQLKTGTSGTVDDIVEVDERVVQADVPDDEMTTDDMANDKGKDHDASQEDLEQPEPDLPETQIRKVSFLEVAVTLT